MPARISGTTSTSSLALAQGGAVARRSSPRVTRTAADSAHIDRGRARLGSAQGSVRRNQTSAVQGQRQEEMLERVDKLVKSMEAVANRISSNRVNSSQRSVLVARFNDLQRQVNELDGIAGGEGRGTQEQESVGRATVASQKRVRFDVSERRQAADSLPEIRAFRDEIRSARKAVAKRQTAVRQNVDQTLTQFEPEDKKPVRASTVQKTREAIQTQGTGVVDNQLSSEKVVNLLA